VFTLSETEPRPKADVAPPAPPRKSSIKTMAETVKRAARTYLIDGNAALDKEWAEF
jgi:methyl-accepting chemotaxis protein